MGDYVSVWAERKFGAVAPELRDRAARAITEAHALAADAQAASSTPKQDPYGHTLKNTQHERLVKALRTVPGVEIHRPAGSRHDLVRLAERRVTFYPLRYASDGRTSRESASIRMSAIRQNLLGSPDANDPDQLTIDHVDLSPEEIDEQLAAEREVVEQLGSLSCVVIIGYASSSKGVHDLGWGEGELNEDGQLHWRYWESLPLPGTSAGDDGFGDFDPLRPVDPQPGPAGGEAGRFDHDMSAEELVISARQGEDDLPQQEKLGEASEAATGEDQA